MDTPAAFDRYDRSLNLDPAERLRAQQFHNTLSDCLKGLGLIIAAFLQGSFARKTMLKPLRDIDKVVILHPQYAYLLADPMGAQLAAKLIEDTLQTRYPAARFERCRHAIKIDLGDECFSFDIVPAFEVDDGSGDVWIMDIGKSLDCSDWKRSNTRRMIEVVAERNQACGGALVHQVRHVKHFVRTKHDEIIPGLHVEAIAFACITTKLAHDEAAELIFSCGAELLQPGNSYSDPTGVEQLSNKLDSAARSAAQQTFAAAADAARRARRLAVEGDHAGAVAVWFDIFGEPFPAPPNEKAFLQRLYGAGLAVATPAVTPTRAWRPW